MSTRRNQTVDLGINSRPLESRFKRKQKTSTTRGQHQKCTFAVPTQNSSRLWRKRKLRVLQQSRKKLKTAISNRTSHFLKKGNPPAVSSSFLSGIILSTFSHYVEQSHMYLRAQIFIANTGLLKREPVLHERSWLQFRDRKP